MGKNPKGPSYSRGWREFTCKARLRPCLSVLWRPFCFFQGDKHAQVGGQNSVQGVQGKPTSLAWRTGTWGLHCSPSTAAWHLTVFNEEVPGVALGGLWEVGMQPRESWRMLSTARLRGSDVMHLWGPSKTSRQCCYCPPGNQVLLSQHRAPLCHY